MEIRIHACPTPGCGSYYGASGMPDLTKVDQHTHLMNFEPVPESQWHSRAHCPNCRVTGRGKVERVLISILIDETELVARPADVPEDEAQAASGANDWLAVPLDPAEMLTNIVRRINEEEKKKSAPGAPSA